MMARYKIKNFKITFILSALLWLTACPAPEFNHVIINQSDSVLRVEYEYVLPQVKFDSTDITAPMKLSLEQYEASGGAAKHWTAFSEANEFQIESRNEEATDAQTGQALKREIKTVKLALLPGEVLRVFVSGHINFDMRNLQRIRLTGERGRLEIEGAGFEQFSNHRPDRFFTDTRDYRIVYK